MGNKDQAKAGPITIKKYANRRLYNTATSSYVTLDHLCKMVKDGDDFVVYDAKTGEDITRSVLTHIIVEEESKGQTLLPINFLRQLIGMYGDNMQWMVPRYLDHSMQMFARNQEQMRSYFQQAMSGMFPFAAIDEMSKQNAAVFERAMQLFSPFPIGAGDPGERSQARQADRKAEADKAAAAAAAAKTAADKKGRANSGGNTAAAASGDKGAPAGKGPLPSTGDPALDRSLAEFEQNMGELRQQIRRLDEEAAAAGKPAGDTADAAAPDAAPARAPAKPRARTRTREAAGSK